MINPTASLDYKRWAPENYKRIVSWLKNYKGKVLLIGTSKDRSMLNKIKGNNKNVMIVTDLNLRLLSVLLRKSKLFITNDGGSMHIAWCTGAKTLALFSKYPKKLEKDIIKGKKLRII